MSVITTPSGCPKYVNSFSAKIGSLPNIGPISFFPGMSLAEKKKVLYGSLSNSFKSKSFNLPYAQGEVMRAACNVPSGVEMSST